ncbi:MAG: hypothetical protein U0166_25940 [Acidobacteriota bacterium]
MSWRTARRTESSGTRASSEQPIVQFATMLRAGRAYRTGASSWKRIDAGGHEVA